jgi:hypothetical protein
MPSALQLHTPFTAMFSAAVHWYCKCQQRPAEAFAKLAHDHWYMPPNSLTDAVLFVYFCVHGRHRFRCQAVQRPSVFLFGFGGQDDGEHVPKLALRDPLPPCAQCTYLQGLWTLLQS